MLKSASENSFLSFLGKNKIAFLFILLLLIGILFFLLPSRESREETDDEERVSELCSSIVGVGECSVILNQSEGRVVSVAVLCEGGDSVEVISDVKALISSLYGIGYNKVTVLKLSE